MREIKSVEQYQLELADLFQLALDTSWWHPIKKIKAGIKAYKVEQEFYKMFPDERN